MAEAPAASGVSVMPVTNSPLRFPEAVKLAVTVPVVKAVPYILLGPVAVTLKAFWLTVLL